VHPGATAVSKFGIISQQSLTPAKPFTKPVPRAAGDNKTWYFLSSPHNLHFWSIFVRGNRVSNWIL